MFICTECCDRIDKTLKDRFFTSSRGLCEECMRMADCLDINHSYLPPIALPQGREFDENGDECVRPSTELERLVQAALAWRKRTDSMKLCTDLALAVDSYKRSTKA